MQLIMEHQWLSPVNISIDWELNPRSRDEDHILDLAAHMNEHGYDEAHPIIVYKIKDAGYNKDLWFADWELNPRSRDEDHILDLAAHMNEHGYDEAHPIIVYKIKDAGYNKDLWFAATGMHRIEASNQR